MTISYSDAAHLLRRAGFGGTQAEINALTPLTLAQAIDKILDVSKNPAVVDPAAITYTQAANYWVDRMRTVPAPIEEKMTLFWHGLWTSGIGKIELFNQLWEQNKTWRSMSMGNVNTFAQKMAIDVAMLFYLDNRVNNKSATNENFARESMELFTLGVDQYTQKDVSEVARAWTGHGTVSTFSDGVFADNLYAYKFNAANHDSTNKTIFGITKNWDGPDVINEIYTGSAKKSIAAAYLADKLWSFFAYPNGEAAPVNAVANALLSSKFEVKAALKAMFLRPEFYTTKAKQGLVRSPIEFTAAALKYAGITAVASGAANYLTGMGQQPFAPPNVAGWHGNMAWITATGMWKRGEFVTALASKANGLGFMGGTAVLSPTTAVQKALDTFGINTASSATKADMVKVITAERAAKGTNEGKQLIALALLSPEFTLA